MGTKRNSNWSVEEDIQLCHAWLDVSQNPIVANNQSGASFWKRVQKEYEKTEVTRTHQQREGRSLQCRMSIMLTACSKFRGCLKQIRNQNPSGASEYDIIRQANLLLAEESKFKKGFKFDHVWDLLKDIEKFADTQSSQVPTHHAQSSQSDGMNTVSSLQDETSLTPEEASPTPSNVGKRPIGVKKAKRLQHRDEEMRNLVDQNVKLIKALSQDTSERKEMERQRFELRQLREDNKVLFADLSSETDPEYKAFILEERAEIMRRRRSERVYAEHGQGSDSQYRATQNEASRSQNDEGDGESDEVQETQGEPGDYSPYYHFLTNNNPTFPPGF